MYSDVILVRFDVNQRELIMSEEQAKKFIEKLQSDLALKDRLSAFIREEGFACTLAEIRKVEWDLMMTHYIAGLPASEHWER